MIALRTVFVVHASTWIRELQPTEGWVEHHDIPREFKTRVGAELYVAGMSAADEAGARRRGDRNRTSYEIREATSL